MLPSLVPRDSAGMARPLTIAKSGASALASISAPRCPATVVASRGSSPTMVMRPSSFGASENRSQTRSLRLSARAILLAAAATTESTRLKLFRPPGWPQPKHKLVVKRALVDSPPPPAYRSRGDSLRTRLASKARIHYQLAQGTGGTFRSRPATTQRTHTQKHTRNKQRVRHCKPHDSRCGRSHTWPCRMYSRIDTRYSRSGSNGLPPMRTEDRTTRDPVAWEGSNENTTPDTCRNRPSVAGYMLTLFSRACRITRPVACTSTT